MTLHELRRLFDASVIGASTPSPAAQPMRTMTHTESRAKYAETLNAMADDREEVVIHHPSRARSGGDRFPRRLRVVEGDRVPAA